MHTFFHKLVHVLDVAVHEIEHGVVGIIHFLDHWVAPLVIKTAITHIEEAALTYADHEFKSAQVRSYAVNKILQVFPSIGENKAYALVSHLMDVGESKVAGLLGHLKDHYTAIVDADTAALPTP